MGATCNRWVRTPVPVHGLCSGGNYDLVDATHASAKGMIAIF